MPTITTFNNGYFLDGVSGAFENNATKLMVDLQSAQEKMAASPDDPSALAAYQAKLQEYTLFRNAQTSTVKAYKDISAAIIQNFR
ncbi:type III secretion system needle filament subunit SctF [Tatumella ptyseos]|uniref:type III secretion system needle filament subunit SctF n=1 Tax=Tatumella ptyseos TaxID=82987 RepID=UPI0026ED0B1B|nr:type III secretion system needle filament subunit SctF [Tatumella ptyseos]WKX25764.1 type III secretion system needle filament subunit SctF [Tatumella ptyseos]